MSDCHDELYFVMINAVVKAGYYSDDRMDKVKEDLKYCGMNDIEYLAVCLFLDTVNKAYEEEE